MLENNILNRIDMVKLAVKRQVSGEIDKTIKEDEHNLKGLVAVCIDHCCDTIKAEVRQAFREGENT